MHDNELDVDLFIGHPGEVEDLDIAPVEVHISVDRHLGDELFTRKVLYILHLLNYAI